MPCVSSLWYVQSRPNCGTQSFMVHFAETEVLEVALVSRKADVQCLHLVSYKSTSSPIVAP